MDMTPLERAARAAAEQYGEDWGNLPDANPVANGELDKAHFIDSARAVLTAIRDPDRETRLKAWGHPGSDGEGHPNDVALYQAMIDAIVKEG